METKLPKVSIIIPTYNEERNIRGCLESIVDQDYPEDKVEVVVVDQESHDKTKEISKAYSAKVINREKPKFYSPPSISRNMGADNSQGDYFFHIDADMILDDRELLKKCIEKIQQENAGALVVHEIDHGQGFWTKCKALERKCYIGNAEMEGARFVRKDIFDKVGGYDEMISSGEDWDIDRKYRKVTKVIFSGLFLIHNIGRVSFWKQIKKKNDYGKTGVDYFKKHNISGFSIVKSQLVCFVKNYQLFFKNPIIGLGTLFFRFCEYSYGVIGMLSNKFKSW